MPVLMVFAREFCKNQLLSRKLAYQCSRKIQYLVSESDSINNPGNLQIDQSLNPHMHPVVSAFLELTSDPYTRFIVQGLSSVLQQITMECPTALVWHYFGKNFFKNTVFPRVSIRGVKSLGGHFACLCRGFDFYEVKKKLYFSKRKWKYFDTFNHNYSEKSSKRANSTNHPV